MAGMNERWASEMGGGGGLSPGAARDCRLATLVHLALGRSEVRYLCVGGACALVNWLAMLLIDRDHYLASSLICFVPIATLSYVLHAAFTFRRRPSPRSYAAYVVGMMPGSTISLAILAAMRDGAGWPLWFAIPATTAIMTIGNFLVSRLAIVGLSPGPAGTRSAACADPQ